MRRVFLVFSLLLCASVHAAPPVGGMPTPQQIVESGCRLADTVAVVEVVKLKNTLLQDRQSQVGTIRVVELIKGNAHDLPRTLHYWQQIPPPTDSFPVILYKGGRNLIFFNKGFKGEVDNIELSRLYSPQAADELLAFARTVCPQGK